MKLICLITLLLCIGCIEPSKIKLHSVMCYSSEGDLMYYRDKVAPDWRFVNQFNEYPSGREVKLPSSFSCIMTSDNIYVEEFRWRIGE